MYLLIRKQIEKGFDIIKTFTFHNVSINSATGSAAQQAETQYLHSIMYLLIHNPNNSTLIQGLHLHSIMYLLIQCIF